MGYQPNRDRYRIEIGKNALNVRRAVANFLDHHANAQPLSNQLPGHGATFRDQFDLLEKSIPTAGKNNTYRKTWRLPVFGRSKMTRQ